MKSLCFMPVETFRALLCNAYEVSWRARSKEVFRISSDAAPRVSYLKNRNSGSPVPLAVKLKRLQRLIVFDFIYLSFKKIKFLRRLKM